MESTNWRVIKGAQVLGKDRKLIGEVFAHAAAPDGYFWVNQHPLFRKKTESAAEDDLAVPPELIGEVTDGWSKSVRLTVSRDEFLALPQRWQVERMAAGQPVAQTFGEQFRRGFAQGRAIDGSGTDNAQANWDRIVRAIHGTPIKTPPPRNVLSSYESALAEMVALQEKRRELIELFGALPPEMEELFAAQRKEIRDRNLAQVRRDAEELMGTGVPDGR